MQLLEQVDSSIRSHGLLPRGARVLVAVSGGMDSMVLLELLHTLSGKHGWKLSIAHFNHQLRGRSSNGDAALVQKTAKSPGLPIVMERGNVKALAKSSGLSLEMAARKLRHEFFARAAKKLGIRTIALAHHADDQVELFFLRLLRGAGGEGIAGMKWQSPSPVDPHLRLIRPLLDVSKADLEKFACDNKIHFRHDASNSSLDIRRNRIRHELLPLLQRQYQSAIARTVLRAMDIIGAEADFVSATAQGWLKQKRRTPFARLPIAVQRRCLQLQFQRLNLPVDFEVIEKLRRTAGKTANLGPGVSVIREISGLLRIHAYTPAVFNEDEVHVDLTPGTKSAHFAGLKFSWQITAAKKPSLWGKTRGAFEYFDSDKIGSHITLRHWQPGDRFHPIGMAAPVKLQDWFVNQKVPRDRRHKLVLAVTANGEIFWVQGQRISEDFKLTSDTRIRLKLGWTAL